MSQYKEKIWLHITSGQGPAECALAVFKLVEHITQQAGKAGLSVEEIETIEGRYKGTCVSALLCFSGLNAQEFITPWCGTIQWICESPYRPGHKRKNWFIGAGLLQPVLQQDVQINSEDITWKTMRASGPGGQHVNTTDSAVQATHRPSGIQVSASEERSQHMNKKRALEKIQAILIARGQQHLEQHNQDKWMTHKQLERGNPVKVFVGQKFLEQ